MSNIFRQFIRKTLQDAKLPCSVDAVELLLMIAAHESQGFRFVQQSVGPALSLYQLEPVAMVEVQRYMGTRPEKFGHLYKLRAASFELLNFDQAMATQAARIYLMRLPDKLPDRTDVDGMARYAKEHWNTASGKATAAKYASDYQIYVSG